MIVGASYLYSVMVEGTTHADIPHAVRFAKRLAETLDGAVVDQQTTQVWSRSRARTIERPTPETRVATVDLVWLCLRADISDDPPKLFLETAKRHLPEALPRRFGAYEPLKGRYADAGAEAFLRFWTTATSTVLFTGTGVSIDGDRTVWKLCSQLGRWSAFGKSPA